MRKLSLNRSVGWCLLVTCWTGLVCSAAPPPAPAAKQILLRVAKVYATCKSYRDVGVVTTVSSDGPSTSTEEKPFKTSFVRPEQFRFEYSNSSGASKEGCVVWRKGKKVQSWWGFPTPEIHNSLGMAMAGATGVSGGSAHTVPSLLMKQEIGGRRITDLKNPKRLPDEKIGSADCYRIEGAYVLAPLTLWVDKKTYVIRRTVSRAKVNRYVFETTTIYEPTLNGDVPAKLLEFNPPSDQ